MSYFSEDFIERVRMASDLIPLVGEDTSLKGRGDQLMGLCPFPDHLEKTPSFSVSASKQVYHCFGCQKSGNIFSYLRDQRGMSFGDALQHLARKANIPLPKTSKARMAPQPSLRPLLDLSEKVCRFYQSRLREAPEGHPVRAYLKRRGFSQGLIEAFRLGYAPKGSALLGRLSAEERRGGLKLGVLNEGAGGLYDNFRNRLIFPIISLQREPIGFGARALDDESKPKYINSKESEIFQKGRVLYGLSESSRFIRQKGMAIVVEGYTDFLSLWQNGLKNAAAVLGTALTSDHARLLSRCAPSAALVFDGDEAGIKASGRSLPVLLAEGMEVRGLALPDQQDPDQFARRHGGAALESLARNSPDLFFQTLQRRQAELKAAGRKNIDLIEEMAPVLRSVKKESLRAVYKQRVLDVFGSDGAAMRIILEKSLRQRTGFRQTGFRQERPFQPAAPAAQIPAPAAQIPAPAGNSQSQPAGEEAGGRLSPASLLRAELLLLVLCLDSKSFLEMFLKSEGILLLETLAAKEIFCKMQNSCGPGLKNLEENFERLPHLIMNQVSESRLLFKESHPVLMRAGAEESQKIFDDCLSSLRNRGRHSEAGHVIAGMKMSGGEEDMKSLEKVFQITKQKLAGRGQPPRRQRG